jgi:nitrate reductase NapAB chaperone NapD
MPIKSYLAVPVTGKRDELIRELKKFKEVELEASTNKDVIVVLTDTATNAEDKQLVTRLNELESLQLITLVSAFSTEDNETEK